MTSPLPLSIAFNELDSQEKGRQSLLRMSMSECTVESCRLVVMTGLAQGLMIGVIPEEGLVAFVGGLVINYCGFDK